MATEAFANSLTNQTRQESQGASLAFGSHQINHRGIPTNVVESRLTHQVTARGILEGFGKSNQINNYQGQVKKSTEYSPKDRNFAEEVTKTLEDAFSEGPKRNQSQRIDPDSLPDADIVSPVIIPRKDLEINASILPTQSTNVVQRVRHTRRRSSGADLSSLPAIIPEAECLEEGSLSSLGAVRRSRHTESETYTFDFGRKKVREYEGSPPTIAMSDGQEKEPTHSLHAPFSQTFHSSELTARRPSTPFPEVPNLSLSGQTH